MPERELLFRIPRSDFRIDTFRAGGKGGQNQNKVESGVRIVHLPSGAAGESREERSQLQNRRLAFARLRAHPKFEAWLRLRAAEIGAKQTIEQRVDEELAEANLVTEVQADGRWVPAGELSDAPAVA